MNLDRSDNISPFDLLSRLSPEISDGVTGSLSLSRVDRDLCIVVLLVLHLDCHQQQLKFDKTDPEMNSRILEHKRETYSAAWRKFIPLKLEERVSVYISHPEPCAWWLNLMFSCFVSVGLCHLSPNFYLSFVSFVHLQVVVLPDRHVRSLWGKFRANNFESRTHSINSLIPL